MGVRFVADNFADSATLTDSPAMVTTLPVTNLQNIKRAEVARSTSTAAQQVLVNFTEDKPISCFVLDRHNLTTGGTITLELFDGTNQSGTEVYDSGAVVANPAVPWGTFIWGVDPWGASIFGGSEPAIFVHYLPSTTIARSARITLTDPDNADGYMQARRLILGRYIEPAIGAQYGIKLSHQERTTQTRSAGGTLRSDPQATYRRLEFGLGFLTDDERRQFFTAIRDIGMRLDCFIALYSDGDEYRRLHHSMVAKVVRMPEFTRAHPDFHGLRLSFEEA